MDYILAIHALVPNAIYYGVPSDEESFNNLDWQDERDKPPWSDVEVKLTELETDYNNKQYQRDRAVAYPALAEQFDKLWHDINNGTLDNTGAFYTALKTVKDDNPKPGE